MVQPTFFECLLPCLIPQVRIFLHLGVEYVWASLGDRLGHGRPRLVAYIT